MMEPTKYIKLPGRGLSRKGNMMFAATRTGVRMWLGDDHLLQVETTGGYSENYKRFYFRDIQAFCLRKTKVWFAANVVLGFLTGIFLLWALTVADSAGVIALGIFTGVFGFFLLLSVLRGPTCTVHLKTAVHYEELASLRRLRHANKVLARIRPLIEGAQGTTATEVLAQQYSSALSNAQATAAAAGQSQVTQLIDPTLSHYGSRAHQVLFGSLLAMMAADVFYIFVPSVASVIVDVIVSFGVLAAVLVALVKQHDTDLKPAVRVVTWISAGFMALSTFLGYITMFFLAPQDKMDGTQWGHIKALAAIHPMESGGWLTVFLVSAAVSGLLGVAGLLLLRQHHREQNIPS